MTSGRMPFTPMTLLKLSQSSHALSIPPILTMAWFANTGLCALTGACFGLWRQAAPTSSPIPLNPPEDVACGFWAPFGDVTETELADLRRIEREKRGRYFLALEERLRSACTARDAVSAACETLGRELRATFAGVGELQTDGLDTVVESAWSAAGDPAPLLGRHRFMARSGSRTFWLAAPSP